MRVEPTQNLKVMENKKHGGAREGAGRPPNGQDKTAHTVRVRSCALRAVKKALGPQQLNNLIGQLVEGLAIEIEGQG